MSAGFCVNHPLTYRSRMLDMEKFCTERYADTWKHITPRDALNWLTNGVGDSVMIACTFGTAHCDAARCQHYFCGDNHVPLEMQMMANSFSDIGHAAPPVFDAGHRWPDPGNFMDDPGSFMLQAMFSQAA